MFILSGKHIEAKQTGNKNKVKEQSKNVQL